MNYLVTYGILGGSWRRANDPYFSTERAQKQDPYQGFRGGRVA